MAAISGRWWTHAARAARPASYELVCPCFCATAGVRRCSRSTTTPTRVGATPAAVVGRQRVPWTVTMRAGGSSPARRAPAWRSRSLRSPANGPRRATRSQRTQPRTSAGYRLRRRCSTATPTRPRTPRTATTLHRPLPDHGRRVAGPCEPCAASAELLPENSEQHVLIVVQYGRDVSVKGQRPHPAAARL